jgi:hypothetical protein
MYYKKRSKNESNSKQNQSRNSKRKRRLGVSHRGTGITNFSADALRDRPIVKYYINDDEIDENECELPLATSLAATTPQEHALRALQSQD